MFGPIRFKKYMFGPISYFYFYFYRFVETGLNPGIVNATVWIPSERGIDIASKKARQRGCFPYRPPLSPFTSFKNICFCIKLL